MYDTNVCLYVDNVQAYLSSGARTIAFGRYFDDALHQQMEIVLAGRFTNSGDHVAVRGLPNMANNNVITCADIGRRYQFRRVTHGTKIRTAAHWRPFVVVV